MEDNDIYDQLVAEDIGNAETDLRSSFIEAHGADREKAGRVSQLARDLGVPPDFAERNYQELEKRKAVEGYDYDSLVRDYAPISEWMRDSYNAKLASDDISTLTRISDAFRAFGGEAVTTMGRSASGIGEQAGVFERYADRTGLNEASPAGSAVKTFSMVNQLLGVVAPEVGQNLKKAGKAISPPAERQNVVTDISGGLGQVSSQIAMFALGGGVVGNTALYSQGVDIQSERLDRQGVEEGARGDLAMVLGGATTFATEKVSLGVLFKGLPGLDSMTKKLPRALQNKWLNRAVDVTSAGGAEAMQEVTEGFFQDVIEYSLYNPDVQFFEEWEREAIAAGGTGAIARAILMLARGRSRINQQSDQIDEGALGAESMKILKDQAAQSALLQRDPVKFTELLERLNEGNSEVRLDADVARAFFQDETFDATELYDIMPEMASKLSDANVTGEDITVPLDKMVSVLARTGDKYDFMMDHIKLSEEGLSASQAAERAQGFDDRVQDIIREFREEQESDDFMRQALEEGEAVERNVQDQLQNMGRSPDVAAKEAALYRSFYETMLERAGVEGQRVLRRMFGGLEIRNEQKPPVFKTTEFDLMLDRLRDDYNPDKKAKRTRKDKKKGKPIQAAIKKRGKVKTGSTLAQELRRLDITPKSAPGLFSKTGTIGDADRFVGSEFADEMGLDVSELELDDNGYLTTDSLVEMMRRELMEADEAIISDEDRMIDDLDQYLSGLGIDITTATNDEIKAAIEAEKAGRAIEEDLEVAGRAMYQDELDKILEEFDELFDAELTPEQEAARQEYYDRLDQENAEVERNRQERIRALEDRAQRVKQFRERFDDNSDIAAWTKDRLDSVVQEFSYSFKDETRGRVAFVDPVDYLLSTAPIDRIEIIDREAGDLDLERLSNEAQTPFLIVQDGEIIGHEGRHRMIALAKEGVRKAPIVIKDFNQRFNSEDIAPSMSLKKQVFDQDFNAESDLIIEDIIPLTNDNKDRISQFMQELSPRILYQDGAEESLVVRHNVRAGGLQNIDSLGGIPAPSLAVNSVREPFDNFGDITLIGNTSIIDPKETAKNKVFSADIYSPRYPLVTFTYDEKVMNRELSRLQAAADGTDLDRHIERLPEDVENAGIVGITDNVAVQYAYLQEIGKDPRIKYKKRPPKPVEKYKELMAFTKPGKKKLPHELQDDPEFKEAVRSALTKKIQDSLENIKRKNPDSEVDESNFAGWFNEDGLPNDNLMSSYASEVAYYKKQDRRYVDTVDLERRIRDRVEKDKGFEDWVKDNFSGLIEDERIFDGFTPSGSRRYLPHNLNTVLRILTRSTRDGEGFNYGVGSLRSMFTKEFKSIKQIKDSADLLVSDEQFDKIKKEVEAEFIALAEFMRPYSRWGEGFGYLDMFSEQLKEAASRRTEAVINEYFDDATEEAAAKFDEFFAKLRNMPTEYFEAKPQRVVQLSEFSGALIPKNTDQKTKDILKKHNVPYRLYDADNKQEVLEKFTESLNKKERVLFQEGKETRTQKKRTGKERGQIKFTDQGKTVIELFDNADMSTFLHETGHFFIENFRQIATLEDAPQQLKNDWSALSEWLSVESAEDLATNIKAHEKFARGFEAYLYKGEAPSASLASAFQRFGQWLIRVYENVLNLNVNVTPEISDILDRMLATDEEIESFRSDPLFKPDPQTLEMLTASQKEQYIKQNEKALQAAKDKLLRKALKQKERQSKKFWKEERKKLREEIEAEVKQDRLYRAWHFLKTGKNFDGSVVKDKGFKLRKKYLRERFGEELFDRMPKGTVAASGGIDPAIVADLFGYTSTDQLVTALLGIEPMKDHIDRLTDDEMIRRHGDMLNDGTLEREAQETVMEQEPAAQMIELQALTERTGVEYPKDGDFKRAAKFMLSGKEVDEAIKPYKYYQAAIRNARAYGKAIGQKDFDAAAEAKRKEILNRHLYRESTEARESVDKALKRFKKLNKMPAKGKIVIEPEYHEKIWDLLSRYNLGPKISDAKRTRLEMQAIADWAARQVLDDNAQLIVPQELMDADSKTHYRDMTMEEFNALRDMVDNLATQGRNKREYLMGEERRKLADVAQEITDKMYENHGKPDGTPPDYEPRVASKKGAEIVDKFFAATIKAGTLLRKMDGFEDLGPAFHYLKTPIDNAMNEYTSRQQKETHRIRDGLLLKYYTKKELSNMKDERFKIDVPEVGSFTKDGLISIALNTRNEGNRQALKDGFGWTEDQLQSVIDSLSKKDIDFVNAVGDYLESFWPEIAALEKRRAGYAPEKIEGQDYEAQNGTIKGGYYPLKYEGLRASNRDIDDAAKLAMTGMFARAQTKRGHTMERVGSAGQKVRLDTGVIYEHVEQVTRDIHLSEAITQVSKVLNHKQVVGAFEETLGEEAWRQLDVWLKDVAVGSVMGSDFYSSISNQIRAGLSISAMGWKISTALIQVSGFAQSVSTIGAKNMLNGFGKWYALGMTGQNNAIAWVHDKSQFMNDRALTFNRDINDARKLLSGPTLKVGKVTFRNLPPHVTDSFFVLMTKMQTLVDVPTWLAAYEKGMKDFKGNEERAIEYADHVVRHSQGSGLLQDLSAIERGTLSQQTRLAPIVRLWTAFYTYFNAKLNIAYEKYQTTDFRNPTDATSFVTDMFLLFWLEAFIGEFILGRLPDEEDDENMGWWSLRLGMNQVAATVPMLRDVSSAIDGFTPGGAGGRAQDLVASMAKQVGQGEVDEALFRSINATGGLVFRYPSSQINTTMNGIQRIIDEETDGPIDAVLGLGIYRD